MKPPAEVVYERELNALRANDRGPKPSNWRLSPQFVRIFILGSPQPFLLHGEEIVVQRKFFGDETLVERCIITLAGSRGLLLVGEPGTAKTMLSELLAAAISGTSLNAIQGTAGTTEEAMKYSWHYPLLLSHGPTKEALVPAPLYTGMSKGKITRFEEISRCPSEIQDALISIMSEKIMLIPELGEEGVLYASPGFNVIATANSRDRGVHEMSGALKRRFNFETVMPIQDVRLEADIIKRAARAEDARIAALHDDEVVELLATIFVELRKGITKEGYRIEMSGTIMSTAEAAAVYTQSLMSAHYFGKRRVMMEDVVGHLIGAVAKDSADGVSKLRHYFQTVIKSRSTEEGGRWTELYEAHSKTH